MALEGEFNLTIRQALTFAILMQDIMDKSPSYILEKAELCRTHRKPDEVLLDDVNKAKFDCWTEHWNISW